MRLAVILLAAAAEHAHACAGLQVDGAWIRQPPPGARVAAGFMELINPSSRPIDVLAIDSTCCGGGAIHETTISDGVAHMHHRPTLRIPAGSRMSLQPRGLHVMLNDPTIPLESGQHIDLTIHCTDGDMVLRATVRRD